MKTQYDHPEQDPAEGSRETIDHDLKLQEQKSKIAPANDGTEEIDESKTPGSEAAEPSPQ